MEISTFVATYLAQRTVSKEYAAHLVRTGLSVATITGRDLSSLDVGPLNLWLASIEVVSPINAFNIRRQVKTIWKAAHAQGFAPPVGELRRIRVPKKTPQALRIEEIARLIDYTDTLVGCFQRSKCARRLYWRSLFMAYYDSALRVGDLRSVERQWIAGGIFSVVQHKVNSVHHVRLRPETMAAIDEYLNGRTAGPIWCRLNRKNFFNQLRKIFDAAGVRGSSKWIRRSSASYVERERPGTGWRHLGHAKPGLAESNYLDPSICAPEPSLPPPLFRPGTP